MSYAALPTLRTPRLTLRPLKIDDADAMTDGIGNYDVSRWLGRVPYPYGREDALAFIEKISEEAHRVWGIENVDGLIGVAGIQEELGYWLARPAWRKGFGFEAARAVAAHWFSDPAAGDLVSGHYNENFRSRSILNALGFRKTGDSLRFAKSLAQEVAGTDVVLTREVWNERQHFELKTARLQITPLAERHAEAFAAATVPEVTRNLARLKTGMTVDEALVDLPRRTWRGYAGFTLALELEEEFVGTVSYGGTSIGYFLTPEFWGQGLMMEALAAFVPELFDRFPVTRLTADHFEDNLASGAILRKLGFEETGHEMHTSMGRLEPSPCITYALTRDKLKVPK